jgi:hypothetical protein
MTSPHCTAVLLVPLALLCACGTETGGVAGVAAPLQAGHAPPALPGLVSWWPGSTTNDVQGPNDGALVNGAAIAKGRIGPGFSFDGVDDYVMVPNHPSLDVGTYGSIVFWMRAAPGNTMSSCCQGLVTTDHFAVEISGGSHPVVGVNFYIFTTTGGFVHTSDANGGGAVVTPGDWHHIAGTYDGAGMRLYVDGAPWGNPRFYSGSILPMLPGSFLAIGSEDGRTVCSHCVGTRYFHGEIDEVAIYNRALTAAEVHALFRRGGSR